VYRSGCDRTSDHSSISVPGCSGSGTSTQLERYSIEVSSWVCNVLIKCSYKATAPRISPASWSSFPARITAANASPGMLTSEGRCSACVLVGLMVKHLGLLSSPPRKDLRVWARRQYGHITARGGSDARNLPIHPSIKRARKENERKKFTFKSKKSSLAHLESTSVNELFRPPRCSCK